MTDPHEVLELTRKLGREPDVDTALHIMQWELGDLVKSWTYSQWHPDLAAAYRSEALHALADLLFQVEVVAQLLGEDVPMLLDFGVDIVEDRIMEKKKKLGRFEHYKGDKEDE